MLTEKHIKIEDAGIPESLYGKRAVFLADIHFGPFFGEKRLKKLVERTNALEPDLVLLGGDYADGRKDNLLRAGKMLAELEPKMSKPIGVVGNHEYGSGNEDIFKTLKDRGLIILNNENLLISENGEEKKMFIAGIDDHVLGEPDLKKALTGTSPEDYVLLLSHNPDISEEIKNKEVDLVLSGHTHGGQITFFGLWAPVTLSEYGQKYVSGVRKTDFGYAITSNGIGTVLLPMRFFARPQILILEFSDPFKAKVKIDEKVIKAEVADQPKERQRGLMDRDGLCRNCGMLFIFQSEDKHSFWMKNTRLPLDMVFLNKDKKVVDIKRAVPCRQEKCDIYQPEEPALYVLEVRAGTFSRDVIGSTAEISTP